jgi:hypothetical protein
MRSDLQAIASTAAWETRADETSSVARAVYLRLPDGIELWVRDKTFTPSHHADLAAALEA